MAGWCITVCRGTDLPCEPGWKIVHKYPFGAISVYSVQKDLINDNKKYLSLGVIDDSFDEFLLSILQRYEYSFRSSSAMEIPLQDALLLSLCMHYYMELESLFLLQGSLHVAGERIIWWKNK